jgi:hypothetical protein
VPRQTDSPSSQGALTSLPEQLDEKARAEIRDAQDVMRQLIERIPRHFDYADEMALIFRARRGD